MGLSSVRLEKAWQMAIDQLRMEMPKARCWSRKEITYLLSNRMVRLGIIYLIGQPVHLISIVYIWRWMLLSSVKASTDSIPSSR
jgi:hypothetical protein